ncbi:MAG: hypothetical protein AB7S78_00675 [Candidatus Omnitrophota bacterium]
MKSYFSQLPAGQVIRSLEKKSWPAYIFIVLLLLLYMLQISKLFVPQIQKLFFKQYQFCNLTFRDWALLQVVPSMYSFANELWWSRDPIDEKNLFYRPDPNLDHYYVWLNHFPLHFVTYNHYRDLFFQDFKKSYLLIRSRYQQNQMESTYTLKRNGGVLEITRTGNHDGR